MKSDILIKGGDDCIIKECICCCELKHIPALTKKVIPKLSDAEACDQEVLGHLMLVAGKVAEQLNLDNTFRVIINNGAKAGQSVFHLHLHLLSGRTLSWPPG